MKRAAAFGLAAALFAVGVVVGALGLHLYQHTGHGLPADYPPPPMRWLESDHRRGLGLDPEQERSIQEVLERHREGLTRLREEMHPRVREELERARAEIEELLTPEQRLRFRRRLPPPHEPLRERRMRREQAPVR